MYYDLALSYNHIHTLIHLVQDRKNSICGYEDTYKMYEELEKILIASSEHPVFER